MSAPEAKKASDVVGSGAGAPAAVWAVMLTLDETDSTDWTGCAAASSGCTGWPDCTGWPGCTGWGVPVVPP